MASVSALAKQLALECGFTLAGVASLKQAPPRLGFIAEWLAAGYAGEMEYLKRQEARRLDPSQVLEGARSMLCVALLYNTDKPYSTEVPGQPWISRYAWGQDYHEVFGQKLKELEMRLRETFGAGIRTRSYVDTGPIAEKAWAAAAGLGWTGKNTCLIHPKLGSWLFLGEVLTDLEMEADDPQPDLCGNCRKCLDACPTKAFPEAYVLDASRCISYLSIEKRGPIPAEFHQPMGHNLYGCDICQDVCPWNHWKVPTTEPAFQAREGNWNPDLEGLAEVSQEQFSRFFKGSPIKRTKVEGIQRNAKVVLKNQEDGEPA